MISVENFYYILYEILIKPVNINLRYYWPFGTTEKLIYYGSNYELPVFSPFVLCHFDQEPIYQEDEELIMNSTLTRHSQKFPRILANSEYSDFKKQICKQNYLLDWYFFYHGFAALDWYRDAQYFNQDYNLTHPFLSFNHLVRHKRSYRMSMIARLANKEILKQGIVSFHGTKQDCYSELEDNYSELSFYSRNLIEKYLINDLYLPIIVDRPDINGSASAHFGNQEYQIRQRALFSLVNETVFYDKKLHLTEKVFQPIVCCRPFILTAAPGNLQYLRSYGFKTFGDYIDESYDTELDNDRRMDLIVEQLIKLCNRPIKELQDMLDDMRPILVYNKQHFFGEFRRIIIDELVENFNQCLRIWNNGRVDGRIFPLHPDPDLVKQILLR